MRMIVSGQTITKEDDYSLIRTVPIITDLATVLILVRLGKAGYKHKSVIRKLLHKCTRRTVLHTTQWHTANHRYTVYVWINVCFIAYKSACLSAVYACNVYAVHSVVCISCTCVNSTQIVVTHTELWEWIEGFEILDLHLKFRWVGINTGLSALIFHKI